MGVASKLIGEIEGDQELRIAAINALYSSIATREDVRRLEDRLARIEERINTLIRWVIGMLAAMWATLAAALLASVLG